MHVFGSIGIHWDSYIIYYLRLGYEYITGYWDFNIIVEILLFT